MGKLRTTRVMVVVFLVWNGVLALGVDPDYYVSPSGNNDWDGEYAEHQEGTNHGPMATIQAGINVAGSGSSGNYKTIHVLNNDGEGCTYNVNSTILLDQYNYQELVFYQDVVVEGGSWFDNDWPPKTWRALFRVENVHDVRFTGYEGATFRLTKEPGNETYNGSHAIWLVKSSNVDISGLTLEKCRGDGINIGYISTSNPGVCEDIEVTDVDCDDNCRNAISVISADGLTIDGCILRNTSGAVGGPCAGIKIEPQTSSDLLKNIVVRNTTISGNAGQPSSAEPKQLGIGLGELTGNPSEPVSITFEDILVTDGPGISVCSIRDDGPAGSIVFEDVAVESTHSGADIRKSANKASLSFENCHFEETGSG
jgi:hypothetical protein